MPIPPEQFSEIAARHGPALVLFARQWCDCPEDVVQESLLSLSEQVQIPDDLQAWLYRVTRNGAINASRSNRRRIDRERCVALDAKPWFEHNPEQKIDAEIAKDLLERLPIEQREIVVAKIWGGLTLQQIATISNVAVSTIHRRYKAALDELRKGLESQRITPIKNDRTLGSQQRDI